MGTTEHRGQPITVSWPIYRNLARVLPWLLFFALFLLPENRTRRAWAVWIPMLVIVGPVILLDFAIASFDGSGLGSLSDAAQAFAITTGSLWLLGDRIAGSGGWTTLGKALIAAVVICLLTLIGFSTLDFGEWFAMPGGLAGVTVGSVVLGFPLAALFCRKRIAPPSFTGGLFLGILGASIVIPGVVLCVVALSQIANPEILLQMAFMLVAALVGGGFLGAATCGAMLGFVMLAFTNGLFLDRLYRVLRKPLPAETVEEPPQNTEIPEEEVEEPWQEGAS
ncbi:MAG: hypothetical protein GY851_26170 [bacterium]|nr:hypothetical protein [bacterium]